MENAFKIACLFWLAVFILWAILWFKSNRTIASRSGAPVKAALCGAFAGWAILFSRGFRPVSVVPASDYAGLALTLAGLGFAVWARLTIGRNWSSTITVQQDHQLMRTGPYAIVRHPIYSGLILASLGTAIIVGDTGGLMAVALILVSLGYKARLEEAFMAEQFPAYEEYRRKVKGLIPGIW